MVETWEVVAVFSLGILGGAIATYLTLRRAIKQAAKVRWGTQIALLEQQIAAREQQIATLELEAEKRTRELATITGRVSELEQTNSGLQERVSLLGEVRDKNQGLQDKLDEITGALQAAAGDNKALHERSNQHIAMLERERTRVTEQAAEIRTLQERIDHLGEERAQLLSDKHTLREQLEQKEARNQEQLALLTKAREELSDKFSDLAAKALRDNNTSFLDLARESLQKQVKEAEGELNVKKEQIDGIGKWIKDTLDQVNNKMAEMEQKRSKSDGEIMSSIQVVMENASKVGKEAHKLSQALTDTRIRGRWGELQLRNVVETAGMIRHCDFEEQPATDETRPDMIVSLPGGKKVVVDSKTPLNSYISAIDCEDEARRRDYFRQHATALRAHIKVLAQKDYPAKVVNSLHYTLLFLPGESFFYAAMENDAELFQLAEASRVIIVSPSSMIAFLRAVGCGWQDITIQKEAEEIRTLGSELYSRVGTFLKHFNALGKDLNGSVIHFNKAARSLESRLLTSIRKFEELGVPSKDKVGEVKHIEDVTQAMILYDESTIPTDESDQTDEELAGRLP